MHILMLLDFYVSYGIMVPPTVNEMVGDVANRLPFLYSEIAYAVCVPDAGTSAEINHWLVLSVIAPPFATPSTYKKTGKPFCAVPQKLILLYCKVASSVGFVIVGIANAALLIYRMIWE